MGGEEEREGGNVGWGGEEEFGGGEMLEGFGEREGLVEEDREGDDFGTGVVGGAVREVAVGGLKDEGGDPRILGAEMDG